MNSVCVFGSVARGDNDGISDRDILVVSSDPLFRAAQKTVWKQRGWSVACYTPARFIQMAKAGSLFVQHIKAEGIVLSDPENFLLDVLETYRPREDYSRCIDESLSMVRLVERLRLGTLEDFWSADVLYTLLRNVGIMRLANDGSYKFAIDAIADELKKRKLIDAADVHVFSSLRVAKTAFRNRAFRQTETATVVDDALRVIAKLFHVTIERRRCFGEEFLKFDDPYHQLRSVEKFLIEHRILASGANSYEDSEIGKIWKLITDPRAYSWQMKRAASGLDAPVEEVVGILKKNAGQDTQRVNMYSRRVLLPSAKSFRLNCSEWVP